MDIVGGLSDASAALGLAKDVWGILSFLRSIGNKDIISAYFSSDGTRLEGSEEIDIIIHRDENEMAVWFYEVKPVDGYVFVREPVSPTCSHEIVGSDVGVANPDSRYWRWIAPVLPGRIYGGSNPPNLKVDFVVFGYRPKALITQVGK